jgi:hypothetical protein
VPGDRAELLVHNEGVTTIRFFATDERGNEEAAKTFVVRIDGTAPEAFLRYDPAARDVVVLGRDALSGPVSGPAPCSVAHQARWSDDHDSDDHGSDDHGSDDHGSEDHGSDDHDDAVLRKCVVRDLAGNSLRLDVAVERDGKDGLEAEIERLVYDSRSLHRTVAAVDNSLDAERESSKELEQELRVSRPAQQADAEWEARKNVTKVTIVRGGTKSKLTLPGLVLLRLATHTGGLAIELPES